MYNNERINHQRLYDRDRYNAVEDNYANIMRRTPTRATRNTNMPYPDPREDMLQQYQQRRNRANIPASNPTNYDYEQRIRKLEDQVRLLKHQNRLFVEFMQRAGDQLAEVKRYKAYIIRSITCTIGTYTY